MLERPHNRHPKPSTDRARHKGSHLFKNTVYLHIHTSFQKVPKPNGTTVWNALKKRPVVFLVTYRMGRPREQLRTVKKPFIQQFLKSASSSRGQGWRNHHLLFSEDIMITSIEATPEDVKPRRIGGPGWNLTSLIHSGTELDEEQGSAHVLYPHL